MGALQRIGIVGLGVISRAYLDTFARSADVRVVAVADLDRARAEAVAATIPGATALPVEALVAHPDVDVVLNLTIPAAHAEIALAAIAEGKDVYGEKPLAADLAAAEEVMAAAARAGVRVGCAPDTVLGTGIQTARAAIDGGLIGRPAAASAVMVTSGHEAWHANPDFYYKPGGGPLLDMGPYYVSALIHLLGPIRSAIGASSRPRDVRTIGSGPRAGERIDVEIDTHVTGVFEHEGGALSTITTSFEGTGTMASPIEVHGDRGSLAVPDPNRFDGAVRLVRAGERTWIDVEPSAGYVDAERGIGLVDFLAAAPAPPRAGGAVALHALEAMTALLQAAAEGRRVDLRTTADRPPLVPLTATAAWQDLRRREGDPLASGVQAGRLE